MTAWTGTWTRPWPAGIWRILTSCGRRPSGTGPLDFEYEKEIVEGTYYEYILTDTIANIQIISLTAYDESHPAGTDVNELFMDYPLRQEDQLTDYKYGYMYGTVFYKIPRTLPQAGVHRFKVVVTTRKGEEFTKETDEITMQ